MAIFTEWPSDKFSLLSNELLWYCVMWLCLNPDKGVCWGVALIGTWPFSKRSFWTEISAPEIRYKGRSCTGQPHLLQQFLLFRQNENLCEYLFKFLYTLMVTACRGCSHPMCVGFQCLDKYCILLSFLIELMLSLAGIMSNINLSIFICLLSISWDVY